MAWHKSLSKASNAVLRWEFLPKHHLQRRHLNHSSLRQLQIVLHTHLQAYNTSRPETIYLRLATNKTTYVRHFAKCFKSFYHIWTWIDCNTCVILSYFYTFLHHEITSKSYAVPVNFCEGHRSAVSSPRWFLISSILIEAASRRAPHFLFVFYGASLNVGSNLLVLNNGFEIDMNLFKKNVSVSST